MDDGQAVRSHYNIFGQRAIHDGNAAEAELYLESAARLENDRALQLLEDGLNLLDTAREDMTAGYYDFLPGVRTEMQTDELECLLRLAHGWAYLESQAPERAKTNLRDAEELFKRLPAHQTVQVTAQTATTPGGSICPAGRRMT